MSHCFGQQFLQRFSIVLIRCFFQTVQYSCLRHRSSCRAAPSSDVPVRQRSSVTCVRVAWVRPSNICTCHYAPKITSFFTFVCSVSSLPFFGMRSQRSCRGQAELCTHRVPLQSRENHKRKQTPCWARRRGGLGGSWGAISAWLVTQADSTHLDASVGPIPIVRASAARANRALVVGPGTARSECGSACRGGGSSAACARRQAAGLAR